LENESQKNKSRYLLTFAKKSRKKVQKFSPSPQKNSTAASKIKQSRFTRRFALADSYFRYTNLHTGAPLNSATNDLHHLKKNSN